MAAFALLLFIASSVWAQGGRTLAEWQRDLQNPLVDVRIRAVQALVGFDRAAVPALTSALGDKEYRVRATAAEALVTMPAGTVVPAMMQALGSTETAVRANAAVVLGGFGSAAMPSVPALARVLKDPNPRVRELAGEALDRITSGAANQPSALPLNCH